MGVEENKQLVKKFFENFSSGKVEDVLATMDDSATWWVAGSFPLSGTKTKQEFAELASQIGTMAPNGIHVTPTSFTAEGDRVALEATSYAEMANGKIYQNEYHFLIEVRDGKVQSVREYLDTMHANEVICE